MKLRSLIVSIALFAGAVAAFPHAGSAEGGESDPSAAEIVVTSDGVVAVSKDGNLPTVPDGAAMMTWGPDGVIWASDNARTLQADPTTGELRVVKVIADPAARANVALADWSCTLVSNTPYKSGANVRGLGEQLCEGNYGTQRVRMRFGINLNFGWGWDYWGNWFYTSYTTFYYASGYAVQFCPTPSDFRYRMSTTGYAKGGASVSTNLLSYETTLHC